MEAAEGEEEKREAVKKVGIDQFFNYLQYTLGDLQKKTSSVGGSF